MTALIDAPVEETLGGSAPNSRKTVLLVDDDEAVRGMMAIALEHLGCDVLTAEGAEDALQIMTGCPAIDLIITDIRMPKMSGIDLAERVRELHPNVSLLYCTGASSHLLEEWQVAEGCILHKPVSLATLQEALKPLFGS